MVPGLQFLEPVSLAATGLKTVIDVGLALKTGEGWDKVRQDAFAVGIFAAGRVATVAARGKVASTAATDLKRVRDARRVGDLDHFRGLAASGERVTGARGARIIKNQSVRLLREFGEDEFSGGLPSWRRSIDGLRRLDLDLPEQKFLDLSRAAVRWANGARAAEGLQDATDLLELQRLVDPTNQHPGVLASDRASERPWQ